VGVPSDVKPVEEMKSLISNVMPQDKLVTKKSVLLVQGNVNDAANILKVEINDAQVAVSPTGAFEMNVPLATTGKHLIVVRATDLKGRTEEHKIRAVRMVKFADVGDDHWAGKPIESLATTGLVEGYPNGSFQPERALSRAELATLLIKAKGIEPPVVTGKVFKDMPASHWAARYVKGAMDLALVKGYPDKTFKPNNKINRTEGVVVLTRFGELIQKTELVEGPYPDLTAKYWASPFIAAAREAGMLDYIGEADFQPKKDLTRAEAIEILAKTSYGSAKVNELLDWSVGFEPGSRLPMAQAPSYSRPGAVSGITRPSVSVPKVKEFSDVPGEYWANSSIRYMATAGIMAGYTDGSFRPDRIVTRGELASILVKAKSMPVESVANTGYSDVPKSLWAAPYVKAAVDSGYLSGTSASKFEPNKGATRADTVSAIVKFDQAELPAELKRGPFPDMTARESSSKYVAAAKEAGMLEYLRGQDFEAGKSITRGELAEILAKSKFGQAKIESMKAAGIQAEESL